VREYIQAGIAGAHIEDQTFPPKSGPRRCISIKEMVGKLRAAMDAKEALDPDFVIMARCDLGGVPGASFAEIIERCQAYKAEAQVDVICPNGLRTWEEIKEAIRLIPGPVVPLIPAHLSPYPSLQEQQDAGAAAAWFPALTTMAGLQANWDFLNDFQQRGTLALDALRAQAATSPWGAPAMAAFWTSSVCVPWRRRISQTSGGERCLGLRGAIACPHAPSTDAPCSGAVRVNRPSKV
jgi:2,3-dimethylmalate lyase